MQTAQGRLEDSARAVVRANAEGTDATDAALAQTAQATLFSEALLGAVHERFAELKAVTR